MLEKRLTKLRSAETQPSTLAGVLHSHGSLPLSTDAVQAARQAAGSRHALMSGATSSARPSTTTPAARRYFTINMRPTLKGKKFTALGEDRMKLPEHMQMTGTSLMPFRPF